jgi:hypothetical protein
MLSRTFQLNSRNNMIAGRPERMLYGIIRSGLPLLRYHPFFCIFAQSSRFLRDVVHVDLTFKIRIRRDNLAIMNS